MPHHLKHILLIDSNDVRLSIRAYMLAIHGYRVTRAASPEEAAALSGIDLVVGVCPIGASFATLAHRARVPSLLIREEATMAPVNVAADAILLAPLCTPADILERVKILAARKRGPRKQGVASEQLSEAVSA